MAFPRTYLSVDSQVGAIRDHFGDRISRPCYIVGNGPSAAEASLSPQEAEEAVIFRANWFFLEEEQGFGDRVDGFFWSVDNKGLRQNLKEVQKLDRYRIGAFFQPHTPSNRPDLVLIPEEEWLTPSFDHWAVLAQDPTLARYLMGRPLPTQGVQMIAFAAMLGFRQIHVAGLDFYAAAARRYAWDVPESAQAHLKPKDLAVGYESAHSLDLDLHLLRTIRQRYRFDLIGVSGMEVIAPYLDRSEPRRSAPAIRPEPPRRAFVTLADGRYALGCLALARSLAKVSDAPLIVLHSDPYAARVLRHLPNVILRKVEPVDNPNEESQSRFKGVYTKLRMFELLELERAVFVDSDCVFLKSVDELFEGDDILAAPDWGSELTPHFNSGVIAFTPSESLRDRVFDAIPSISSSDGGDQGLLNALFGDEVKLLPPEFNTLKRLPVNHPNLISMSDVRILHFVGMKPWNPLHMQKEFVGMERLWASFLEAEDWRHVFWMNKMFASGEVRQKAGAWRAQARQYAAKRGRVRGALMRAVLSVI